MASATQNGLSEFALIDTYLKPLAASAPGAFSLKDDAAVLPDLAAGHVHVVTKDALATGVHMRSEDSPANMARKTLRVNLSDLAAMGAKPVGFFMALCLGADTDEAFLEAFVSGLAEDIAEFSFPLMGGDIIKTAAPFTVTITAVGAAPADSVLRRTGAQPGDSLWVSGTIGDGALGLMAAKGDLPDLSADSQTALIRRYQVPQPRLALGQALQGLATACIDISDGLVADVTHLCEASNLGCRIEVRDLPLSSAARHAVVENPDLIQTILNGGDDYELAWSVSPELENTLPSVASAGDIAITQVGRFTVDEGVNVADETGSILPIALQGYRHL